jgi:aquaporin Z
VINGSAVHGSIDVASGYSAGAGFWMVLLLTFGLVSVIRGTASGAQNIGIIAAMGVGAYIDLAGSVGQPDLRSVDEPGTNVRPGSRRGEVTDYWVSIAGRSQAVL